MFSTRMQVNLWKIYIVLEIINYQIVTILCNDFIVLKLLRDALLMLIFAVSFSKGKIKPTKIYLGILVWSIFIGLAVLRTDSLTVSLTYLRKYLSPVIFLISIFNTDIVDEKVYAGLLKFLLNVFFVFSIWGIFQAFILGPSFLIKLGYPTKFSNVYKTTALKDSFYFGNLGIQRVVGTLSNANVCAGILGVTLIAIVFNYKKVITSKWEFGKLICVALGYLLTFSRANFLALIIVAIIIMWKYIPKKTLIVFAGILMVGCFVVLYFIQDDSGITHKLVNWVVNSLQFKESSAAGRTGIWGLAVQGIKENPFGMGFGHTGTGVPGHVTGKLYSCENSYFAMALDLGIFGLISFVIYIGTVCAEAIKYRANKTQFKQLATILIYVAITYMFSNHIYDRELNMVLVLIVGTTITMMRKVRA